MNPTEEWAKAEAVNVVAAIRGLGKDPAEWPIDALSIDQAVALSQAIADILPAKTIDCQIMPPHRLVLNVAGWQTDPSSDEPKRIRWREFL